MSYTLRCNNQYRPIIGWHDLTEKERAEFDWIEPESEYGYSFFRYRGQVHCLSDYMVAYDDIKALGFDALQTDTAFSAYVIKLSDDNESVRVGYVYQ
jgi:hypothetical protein